MEMEIFLVNKVESIKSVQSNRALIGLHKEVMSLSTIRTRSRDNDQQIYVSSTGQRLFSSVPNGVFNLLSTLQLPQNLRMEAFGRLHCVIDSNKLSKSYWERNLRQ